MVSSQFSQPAKNRLEYTAHPRVEEGSPLFTLFNHAGLAENILQPLSEKTLKSTSDETGIYNGFNVEGEASPRIAFHVRWIFSLSAPLLNHPINRHEAHA